MRTEDDNRESELRSYLQIFARRKWIFLACAVLIPVAVFILSAQSSKSYDASAVVQVEAQTFDTSLFLSGSSSPQLPGQTVAAAARLTQTPTVAQLAGRRLHPPVRDARSTLGKISVSTDTTSGFLTITASDATPVGAADLANAYAQALVDARTAQGRARIQSAVSELQGNLTRTPPSDAADRAALSQQIQRLRALSSAQAHNAEIVQTAAPSSSPASPRPLRDAAIALLLALVLATIIAYVVERLDRKVHESEEVERLSGAPLLGTISNNAFPGERPDPEVAEAFRTLRASLTYFNVDRDVTSVLITSPLKGDGKTTVATHLALAEAEAGRHVILVDCDLRHPQAALRLGVSAERGVGAVLVGECSLDEALADVSIKGGRLEVLPAGPPPPNPSELIGSARMHALLTTLTERCDMVIIDAPPALVVSDAIPLLERVSGILLVARLDWTLRDPVSRLAAIAQAAHGTVLGVVVTGAKSAGLYGYGGYAGNSAGAVSTSAVDGASGERAGRLLAKMRR